MADTSASTSKPAGGSCPFHRAMAALPLVAAGASVGYAAFWWFSRRGRTKPEAVRSAGAPAAIGPYTQAVRANGTVYVSGCIALDAKISVDKDAYGTVR